MSEISIIEKSQDLVDIVISIVEKIYGEEAREIVNYLIKNDYIIEEKIPNSVNIRSNDARKILQKLSDEVLVIPDKIREDNGTLHIWRLNKLALRTFVINRLKKTREKLIALLNHERDKSIYECTQCGRKYLVDEAYTHEFQCPLDGGILREVNDPTIEETLKSTIRKIDIFISMLERVKSA